MKSVKLNKKSKDNKELNRRISKRKMITFNKHKIC